MIAAAEARAISVLEKSRTATSGSTPPESKMMEEQVTAHETPEVETAVAGLVLPSLSCCQPSTAIYVVDFLCVVTVFIHLRAASLPFSDQVRQAAEERVALIMRDVEAKAPWHRSPRNPNPNR